MDVLPFVPTCGDVSQLLTWLHRCSAGFGGHGTLSSSEGTGDHKGSSPAGARRATMAFRRLRV